MRFKSLLKILVFELYCSFLEGLISTKYIAIIILSQENEFHAAVGNGLKNTIIKQYEDLEQETPTIYLAHQNFSHLGSWTIFPILLSLSNDNDMRNIDWFIFIQDATRINPRKLHLILTNYESAQEIWIGNELHDDDATIIHHFAFHDHPEVFKYPNIASGFAVSGVLLKSVGNQMKNVSRLPDFSIDNSHELAMFIWDNGNGPALTNDPSFCIRNNPDCATYVASYPSNDKIIPRTHIFFAVKTFSKFHNVRVPVIKNTWGKAAINIKYFSDVEEKSIPTIGLKIPNTERGHCSKTLAILRYIENNVVNSNLDVTWIAVVDDDTILSVTRLQRLLSRYNSSNDVAIGERYGYNVAHTPAKGYNYITGGGGMVFTLPLVKKLNKNCKCPTHDAPDDMMLGACMKTLNVHITHSPAFHQARPTDYSTKYLQNEEPVSFHKHWMIDPYKVYEEWFAKSDNSHLNKVHSEL